MTQSKIYVGNLSYSTTNDDLSQLFATYGKILEVKIITDQETARSKGFAFVTFETPTSAQSALAVNGSEFQGRQLKVSFAKENTGGGGRSGGGGQRRGGGRGGFGGHQGGGYRDRN